MANALKKITTEAKKIYRKGGTWKAAIKKAGQKYRGEKKTKKRVGATKFIERGEPKNAKANVYQVKRSAAGRYKGVKKVGEVKINKSSVAAYYKTQLGNQLVKRELAKTKTEKRKLSQEITKTRQALRFFQ